MRRRRLGREPKTHIYRARRRARHQPCSERGSFGSFCVNTSPSPAGFSGLAILLPDALICGNPWAFRRGLRFALSNGYDAHRRHSPELRQPSLQSPHGAAARLAKTELLPATCTAKDKRRRSRTAAATQSSRRPGRTIRERRGQCAVPARSPDRRLHRQLLGQNLPDPERPLFRRSRRGLWRAGPPLPSGFDTRL